MNLVLFAALGVVGVLYVLRRKSRLKSEAEKE
jgi:hypothetical protein